MKPSLPAIPRRILTTLLPERLRDEVLGDLEEMYRERLCTGPRWRAAAWAWRQAAALGIGVITRRIVGSTETRRRRAEDRPHRLDSLLHDLRSSARALARSPRTSLVMVVILALGIGANTAAFAFLDMVALDPFPYRDPGRIVHLVRGHWGRWSATLDTADWAVLREADTFLGQVAAYREESLRVTLGDRPDTVFGARVSAGLFELLGVEPILGRTFAPDEADGGAIAVLSHHLWQAAFEADPNVVGQTIRVGRIEHTVVGVMPPNFAFYQAAVLWIPLGRDPAPGELDGRGVAILGRLEDGVTLAQARSRLGAVERMLEEDHRDVEAERPSLSLLTLREGWSAYGIDILAGVLQAAAGMLLVVVLANVACLQLVRGIARRREIGLRRALGADDARVVRLLLLESLLLVASAAAASWLVAVWTLRAFVAVLSSAPLLDAVAPRLDGSVFAFMLAVGTLAVFGIGLVPASELTRLDLAGALKDWGIGSTTPRRTRRWHASLTVAQIALSVFLLVGAAIGVRSIAALRSVEPGFDARRVLEVWLALAERFGQPEGEEAIHRILERLQDVPGVESVAWTSGLPPDVRDPRRGGPIETLTGPSDLRAFNLGDSVGPGYFATLGIPLLRGRTFALDDDASAPRVAVVAATAAARLWPETDPIGQQLRFPGSTVWLTVVGVVGDVVRVSAQLPGEGGSWSKLAARPWPQIYVASRQYSATTRSILLVRPARDPESLTPVLQEAVHALEPDLPVTIRTVWRSDYEPNVLIHGVFLWTIAPLGVVAVVLTVLGIYGLISYAWMQRTREIGVRLALGADACDIRRLVMRDGQRLTVPGIVCGAVGAVLVYRLASRAIFGLATYDPISYAAVAALLLAVAAAASLGPARRAMRTDPAAILRHE